jgi:hypothetical protein
MGLPEVLTAVFVVLKLTGLIAWPWIWVFSPILIVFTLVLLLNVVFTLVLLLNAVWLLCNR